MSLARLPYSLLSIYRDEYSVIGPFHSYSLYSLGLRLPTHFPHFQKPVGAAAMTRVRHMHQCEYELIPTLLTPPFPMTNHLTTPFD